MKKICAFLAVILSLAFAGVTFAQAKPAAPPANTGSRSNPVCACWPMKPAFPRAQCKVRFRSCNIGS